METQESNTPLISIITVVYNGTNVLEKTINSISNLDYPNIEYIIIDGKSTDGTIDLIKKYDNKISKWISETDKGLYDAMNKGLKIATGKYIWFLNAGDTVNSRNSIDILKTKVDADIYYSDTKVVDTKGNKIGMLSELTHNNAPKNLTWKSMKRGMVVCHQSFIVKKNIATFFDTNYKLSSDIDWVIKCLKNAEIVIYSNQPFANFLKGGVSKANLKKSMKERYYILKKHFGFIPNLINHFFISLRYLSKGRKSKLNI